KRDVRRAAAFLWITPLAPALFSRFWATRTSSSALSASDVTAWRAVFTRDFSSVRTPLLRIRRFSFWRFRFFCDWMLAIAECHSKLSENRGRLPDPLARADRREWRGCDLPRPDPLPQHHCAHRPRKVDAGRSVARDDRRG